QGTRAGSRERERAPAVRQTDAVLGAVPRKAAATLAPIPNICLAISMPSPPWSQPHGVDAIVEQWLASGSVRRCLAAERLIGSRDAEHAPIPERLAPALRRALAQRGIEALYSHQRLAVDAALDGRHVVVATPTASGKSLC